MYKRTHTFEHSNPVTLFFCSFFSDGGSFAWTFTCRRWDTINMKIIGASGALSLPLHGTPLCIITPGAGQWCYPARDLLDLCSFLFPQGRQRAFSSIAGTTSTAGQPRSRIPHKRYGRQHCPDRGRRGCFQEYAQGGELRGLYVGDGRILRLWMSWVYVTQDCRGVCTARNVGAAYHPVVVCTEA